MSTKKDPASQPQALNRRTALAGAGAVGAAAAAAALLSRTPAAPAPEAVAKAAEKADAAVGYRESEHVLHYYRTARV